MLRVGSFESVEKQDYLGLKFLMHKPDLLCFPSCLYKISLPHDTSSSQSQFSPSWNLPNNLSVPLDWISVWVTEREREGEREREDHLFIEVILLWLQTFKIYAVWKMEKENSGSWNAEKKILEFIAVTSKKSFLTRKMVLQRSKSKSMKVTRLKLRYILGMIKTMLFFFSG